MVTITLPLLKIWFWFWLLGSFVCGGIAVHLILNTVKHMRMTVSKQVDINRRSLWRTIGMRKDDL